MSYESSLDWQVHGSYSSMKALNSPFWRTHKRSIAVAPCTALPSQECFLYGWKVNEAIS